MKPWRCIQTCECREFSVAPVVIKWWGSLCRQLHKKLIDWSTQSKFRQDKFLLQLSTKRTSSFYVYKLVKQAEGETYLTKVFQNTARIWAQYLWSLAYKFANLNSLHVPTSGRYAQPTNLWQTFILRSLMVPSPEDMTIESSCNTSVTGNNRGWACRKVGGWKNSLTKRKRSTPERACISLPNFLLSQQATCAFTSLHTHTYMYMY